MACLNLLTPQNSPLTYVFTVFKSMDEETEANKKKVNSLR